MNRKRLTFTTTPRPARLALAMLFSIVAALGLGVIAPASPAEASGAITAMYNPYFRTVSVTGDGTANNITIGRTTDGKILVNGGAVPISGGAPTVANTVRIDITGRDGDDRLVITEDNGPLPPARLDGGPGNDLLSGGDGADTLIGGEGRDAVLGRGGNDTAYLGDDDDTVFWNLGDENDIVEGQGGRDSLRFTGTVVDEQIELAASDGRVRLSRNPGGFVLDLAGIEQVDLWAYRGADVVTINNLAGTALAAVTLDLAAAAGGNPTDGHPDQIIVNGTGGADVVAVASNQGIVTVGGLAAGVTIRGAEAARDTLRVNGLSGDDILDAGTLPAGLIGLTLDGGIGADVLMGSAGNDTIIGGDGDDAAFLGGGDDTFLWVPGDDNDDVEGQGGFDTVRFTGGNVSEEIALSANGGRVRLTRNVASVVMDLNDIERVNLATLGGADTITLGDLAGTDLVEAILDLAVVLGGGGDVANDRVIVNGTNGDDAILVHGGQGAVSVSGLAAGVTIRGAEASRDTLHVNALGGHDVLDARGLAAGKIGLTLDGGPGDDVLLGSAGDDKLLGGPGDDVLFGGPGNDTVDGGLGDDFENQD